MFLVLFDLGLHFSGDRVLTRQVFEDCWNGILYWLYAVTNAQPEVSFNYNNSSGDADDNDDEC